MKPRNANSFYNEAYYYDLQFKNFKEDIDFYLKQVRKFGEPILELASGTGRITIPFVEKGYRIKGIDISRPMITLAKAKAKEKKLDLEVKKADVRNFFFKDNFNSIIFPFNSISHLHDREGIQSCFKCVRNHLKDKGVFIVSVFNPDFNFLIRDNKKRYPVTKFYVPQEKITLTITENNIYDKVNQINHIKWYYRKKNIKKEYVKELNMRIFFPQELDMLLYYNHFKIIEKYGNYKGDEFKTNSPLQIVICRKN